MNADSQRRFDVLRANLHEQEIRKVVGAPGDGSRMVYGVAPLDVLEDRCLYFINKTITPEIESSFALRQGCIAIAKNGSGLDRVPGDCLVIEVADPRGAIAKVLEFIRAEGRDPPWLATRNIAGTAVISPLAVVEGNVEIGEDVVIEPFCIVGPEAIIGRGSIIRSGVRLYPRVVIGERCVIGANAVVGSDGFGFVRDEEGNKMRVPHLGGVIIGSHVEIGTLSVIERGTLSPTVVEDGVKIGELIAIGHNARIGRGASLVGGAGVGGSAVIGAEAWIGMNANIRDGCRVGSRALVGMGVCVQADLGEGVIARAPDPKITSRGRRSKVAP